MAGKKQSRYMGFGMLAVAAVFLFNPDVAMFDVLPDFIAYILIVAGITQMSYICPHIENARVRFSWAAVVAAAKFVSLFLVFGMSNQNERPVVILLTVFSFAVIELILLVPAWCSLFEGILYLGSRTGAMAPYRSKHGRFTMTGVAKAFTLAFVFIKPTAAVLPEFSALTMGGFDETKFNWYDYIGLLREFGIFFCLIAGIVWFVIIERYFLRLKNDAEFVPAIRRKYDEEVSPNDSRFIKRRIGVAFALLAAAFFFEIDIMLEYNNIIPDALAALCFMGYFLMLRGGLFPQWKIGVALSGAYAVISGVSDWLQYDFNSKYFNALVWQSNTVRNAFMTRYAFVFISSAVFVAVAFFAARAMKHIVYCHAGFIAENSGEEFRNAKLAEIRGYLYRWINSVQVMAVVCAVGACVGDAIITMNSSIYDRLGIMSGAVRTLSNVWWIISALLCLVNFILVLKTEAEVESEIESRYMLS